MIERRGIMDQEKIGKFIAKCRKEQGLTQAQLAEMLGITYKAVSKWESGKGLPDPSRMIDLCNILKITVNDLLSGEKVEEKNYVNKVDDNLIELQKQKQAMNMAVRICYLLIAIILFICNFLNVILYGIEEATKKPEFFIMVSIALIWLFVYTYIINKVDSKRNMGYVIAIFVIGVIVVLLVPLFFTILL